ncbi:glycosyltransferase [Stenotrophomonas sp. NLF4-10]|uniref:glycosyltransferase n=1 Tax=Stenotrophomonas sp. NLF4-10 TaxID=2918754 RepID=UPI001EFBE4DD|nr:glycosyltransferase [Stenotrophomonas sp. NLF4-10]MCG8276529.1 glycosyltransferase [Stenotrophomonas sp. NLF4-10]
MPTDPALTSILVPAYKAKFFRQALDSALAQTWPELELIVCDDSGDESIAEMVEQAHRTARFPILYSRNATRLGELASTARGIALARGRYIKLLHDDDVLEPECVASLVAAIESRPGIALASSRRQRIGGLGRKLPDIGATVFPFDRDVVVNGQELVSFLADHTINFIGEPSCVLCRREDLLEIGDELMSLDGKVIHWVGDLALYAKLLRHGDLAMLAAPLTNFRVSARQFSQIGRDQPGVGEQGHADFRQSIRGLGWYRSTGDGTADKVTVTSLDASGPAETIDLRERLEQAFALAHTHMQMHEWLVRRQLLPAQAAPFAHHLADAASLRPTRLGILIRPRPDTRPHDIERTLVRLPLPPEIYPRIACRVLGHPLPTPADAFMVTEARGRYDDAPSLDEAVADWDVDWLLMVEAGTEFSLGGLPKLMLEIAEASPGLRALHADEWYRDDNGALAPVMRSDFDIDQLLGNPAMLAGHWVFRREALLEAGGFDPEAGNAAELDLILRLVQQGGFDGIAHLPEPLLTCAPPRFDAQAQQRVITRHLHARGYANAAVVGIGSGLYRIDYGHDQQPSVSLVVIVPAGTTLAALERCVVSVLEKTRYPNYELLLINNGAAASISQWMQQVETLAAGRVRAFAFDPPLAHSAACNVAATQAAGDYLLFLRPEVAALQPQWLDELLNHGLRPEVGVVGAKTISADGKITHAGLVPGLTGSGGRAFAGQPMDAPGYMNRLQVAQSYSAVADSCLLIDKALFMELDGFDHATFADEGADVDLCLRARQRGYLTIWTPHALLLHSVEAVPLPESANDALLERWLPALAHDPAYNPSLRLDVPGGFRLGESDFSWQPLPWRPIPRVLAHPADPWGSGHYRVIQPFEALKAAGQAEGALYATLLDTVEQARIDPDVVVLQRRVTDEELERMRRMPRFSRALKVFELDDYLPNLPVKNIHREHMPRDILRSLRRAFALVDRVVVSTPALAEAFAGMHPDIRIAGNRLPPAWWRNLPAPRRNTGTKPRVGWAGGVSHAGDLEMIAGVITELAGEVDWVFLGMCPEQLRPCVAEFHPGVDITVYPRTLARLNLDLAIAPLEQNRFNECKSNLRLLEYGACAVPVVCSDVGPYRGDDLPATRVRNRHRDWVGAIRGHLADADARAATGDALRTVVHRDWMLADAGLEEWRAAWLP